jgi:positive regulator of sigma E activity
MKRTLEEQRLEFSSRRFLATPLAGLIVWTIVGFAGIFFSDFIAVWAIFIGTGEYRLFRLIPFKVYG